MTLPELAILPADIDADCVALMMLFAPLILTLLAIVVILALPVIKLLLVVEVIVLAPPLIVTPERLVDRLPPPAVFIVVVAPTIPMPVAFAVRLPPALTRLLLELPPAELRILPVVLSMVMLEILPAAVVPCIEISGSVTCIVLDGRIPPATFADDSVGLPTAGTPPTISTGVTTPAVVTVMPDAAAYTRDGLNALTTTAAMAVLRK